MLAAFALAGCEKRAALENYRLAQELLKSGNYKVAASHYAQVVSYAKPIPEVVDSYYKLGVIYSKYLNDPTSAVFYLEEMVRQFPDSDKIPLARKEIAEACLYKLGKPEKSVEQLNLIEKNHPKVEYLDEVVYLKGKSFTTWKQHAHAVQAFASYSSRFPASKFKEEVKYLSALNALSAGQPDAPEMVRTFIARYPRSSFAPMARFDLGVAHENAGRYQEALDSFRAVGSSYPNQEALKTRIAALEERISRKKKPAIKHTPKHVKKAVVDQRAAQRKQAQKKQAQKKQAQKKKQPKTRKEGT